MRDGPDGAEIYNRLETVQVGTDDNGDPIFSCGYREPGGTGENPEERDEQIITHFLRRRGWG